MVYVKIAQCVQAAGNLSFSSMWVECWVVFSRGPCQTSAALQLPSSAAFVLASVPAMLLYRSYGHLSLGWNVLLMAAAGCFVNGPYALITTAVSADLGNHSSVAGDPTSQAAGVTWYLGPLLMQATASWGQYAWDDAASHVSPPQKTCCLSGYHCSLQTAQPSHSDSLSMHRL